MLHFCRFVLLFVVALLPLAPAWGAVTRIEITGREPYKQGAEVPGIGPCEWIRGRVHFAVNPRHPANGTVVDLELAPVNAEGLVEFAADLEILAPTDLSRANGTLFYDVNNRGRSVCLRQFDDGADDFLLRQGLIVVWSGWIAELLPGGGRLQLDAPFATDSGNPITGPVRAEFVSDRDADRHAISHFGNHGSYPPTAAGLESAVLTWRLNERDPRVVIPRDQWRLHQEYVEADGRRSKLPRIELEVAGGIRSGYIYELVYEAEGPLVHGLGLAGIRDLISFLKHDASEQNPLRVGEAPAGRWAIGFGVSQSGRCLRQLLYDGFNADEEGRRVFDGLMPHVAGGGMGSFNHRFASPTRHNTQHDNHLYPADVFPFTYGTSCDPFARRSDALQRRAAESGTLPKIMHTQTTSEYWSRAGSLVHTDTLAVRDAPLPENVRIYTFAGAQHGPGSGIAGPAGNGQLPNNPTDYRPLMRGLLVALNAWVRDDTPPPPSVYPTIADGTLTGWKASESGWRPLPGVRYPEIIHAPLSLDRGPKWLTQRIASIEPPREAGAFVVRVPGYDADNNERGCLQLPTLAVPVATFTGWNLRARSVGAETELLSLAGGYLPFAADRAAREATGDPRLSLAERYDGFEDYFGRFQKHVETLIEGRYVLEEDRPGLEALAERHREVFGK